MAWSRTEPALPNGSTWVQAGTTHWFNNNTDIATVVYVARLQGKGFAIRVDETRQHKPNQWSGVWTDLALRCDINGVTGEMDTSFKAPGGYGKTVTETLYFTGEASANVPITVFVGLKANEGDSTTFNAPALIGATVYIKIGGVWKPVQIKVKVGGVWKDAVAKIKVGGTWK